MKDNQIYSEVFQESEIKSFQKAKFINHDIDVLMQNLKKESDEPRSLRIYPQSNFGTKRPQTKSQQGLATSAMTNLRKEVLEPSDIQTVTNCGWSKG